MTVNLLSEHPKTMIPAFDRRQGLRYSFGILLIKNIQLNLFSIERFLNY
jgi:hypothetical protein